MLEKHDIGALLFGSVVTGNINSVWNQTKENLQVRDVMACIRAVEKDSFIKDVRIA